MAFPPFFAKSLQLLNLLVHSLSRSFLLEVRFEGIQQGAHLKILSFHILLNFVHLSNLAFDGGYRSEKLLKEPFLFFAESNVLDSLVAVRLQVLSEQFNLLFDKKHLCVQLGVSVLLCFK